ncbi:lamin tail domain-containing protein [Candidatus Nanosynbacter sp. TM7-087]|uniref:lamin tail domain-containing protein n=1 Tax=Candidatus Nanosynbacter sp. TM7-087 TaxID=2902631 RepID=UPI001FB85686|nr:lamin tail domain-containing protein [Candidatus Nanosynbacter sp. TM7-087]MCJ1966545.1 lamin tail domain-containing protein [Candidatus Nanosynbacter sp. TM7-087]
MKYLRNTLLMILAAALIMPSPLVLAEGASNATQESKVDDAQTVDNSLKSTEEAKDSVVDKEQIDSNSPSQSSENPETLPENPSTNDSNENPIANEPPKPESNSESEPPKTDNSDKSTEENAPILISKISQDKKYVEIYNPTNQNVNLAGWKIEYYARSSAKPVGKIFKDEVILANGFLVLSNDKMLAGAIKFDNNLGLAQSDGSVVLLRSDGSVADTVGWGSNSKSAGSPIKGGVKIVWRCFVGENIIDSKNNSTVFLSSKGFDNQEIVPYSRPNCKTPDSKSESPKELNKCEGLKLSEIASNVDEQFIEIINSGEKTVITTGCKLTVGDSGVRENIGDIELNPGEFLTIKIKNTNLKLPKTKGKVYLLDEAGSKIDSAEYEKLSKSSSWSLIDDEWMQTFMITENSENIFKEYPDCQSGYERNVLGKCVKISVPPIEVSCPAGQYRHPETGRCRKIEVEKTITPCKDGYYRSEETGRCRSIASAAAKTLKPCPEGQFRNSATGRCKKIASTDDIAKECPEGFERNPQTKRCRKIKSASMPTVGSAAAEVKQVAGATWGWWVFGGVSLLAVGYGVWQWRWEISQFVRKIHESIKSANGK